MRLTVHELPVADAWKDMVRVPRKYRKDSRGKPIHRNKVCKITVGSVSKLLAVRGCDEQDARILMDSPTRHDLGVKVGDDCDVEVKPTGWFGYWQWAWRASDPAYRIPAQISLISLILGIIALILGVWPLIRDCITSR